MDGLYHFNIPETLSALAEIFPTDFETQSDVDFGENTTFRPRQEGYGQEHKTIFKPINEAYDLLLAISGLIAIEIGSFG